MTDVIEHDEQGWIAAFCSDIMVQVATFFGSGSSRSDFRPGAGRNRQESCSGALRFAIDGAR
jgi:hypothetical protein